MYSSEKSTKSVREIYVCFFIYFFYNLRFFSRRKTFDNDNVIENVGFFCLKIFIELLFSPRLNIRDRTKAKRHRCRIYEDQRRWSFYFRLDKLPASARFVHEIFFAIVSINRSRGEVISFKVFIFFSRSHRDKNTKWPDELAFARTFRTWFLHPCWLLCLKILFLREKVDTISRHPGRFSRLDSINPELWRFYYVTPLPPRAHKSSPTFPIHGEGPRRISYRGSRWISRDRAHRRFVYYGASPLQDCAYVRRKYHDGCFLFFFFLLSPRFHRIETCFRRTCSFGFWRKSLSPSLSLSLPSLRQLPINLERSSDNP